MKPLLNRVELFAGQVLDGSAKGIAASLFKAVAYPVSLFYRCGSFFRNYAYDHRWIASQKMDAPVVSIGNLVAGGVGKTPLVIKLAKEMAFCPPGIVLRGYRSEAEKQGHSLLFSKGEVPASVCGDEAYMISQNAPESVVCVGRHKRQSAKMVLDSGVKWILLDDGLQHRQLARDLEVVILNAADPFGGGKFLPAGYLRDQISSLKRADLLVVSGGALRPEDETRVRKHTSAPIVQMKQAVTTLHQWDGSLLNVDIKGLPVAIFCGIANPSRFYASVEGLGAVVVDALYLPDHLAADEKVLETFILRCKEKGAKLILCTEKDRVKLPDGLSLAWVKTGFQTIQGQELWDGMLRRITHLIEENHDRKSANPTA